MVIRAILLRTFAATAPMALCTACLPRTAPHRSLEAQVEAGNEAVPDAPTGRAARMLRDAYAAKEGDEESGRDAFRRSFSGAPAHGTTGHLPFGCPACVDPMSGFIPDVEVITGPAKVWN